MRNNNKLNVLSYGILNTILAAITATLTFAGMLTFADAAALDGDHMQDAVGTNTTLTNQVVRKGWGFIQGNGKFAIEDTPINYGITFDELPFLIVKFANSKQAAEGDPVDLSDCSITRNVIAAGVNQTNSGFKPILRTPTGLGFPSATNFCYTWIAIGRSDTSYDGESDPLFAASEAAGISQEDIENWYLSYDWGDHSVEGYLTSYTETDPEFGLSASAGITVDDITNWDDAYGWGNHSAAGYLTSYSEYDPIFEASIANGILETDITNWDSAYAWGDHSSVGYDTTNDPWTGTTDVYTTSGKVGIGVSSPAADLHVDGDGGVLFTGTLGAGTIPVEGAGTRMMWYPGKGAFRAGHASGTEWDDISVGERSFAAGFENTAPGLNSVAMGAGNTASGGTSTALGGYTTASGLTSTSFGLNTTATGDVTTAMGELTTASGRGSVSMGYRTTAQAHSSLVIGRYNIVEGDSNSWVTTDPLFVIGNGTGIASTSNALTVLKNGDIGIGTSSPGHTLDVKGTINASTAIKVNGVDVLTSYTETDPEVGANTASYVPRWSGTRLVTGAIYDNASGKIGIGTTSLGATLNVSGNDGALFTGTYGSGIVPVEGGGTRMMWFPKKAAFRAGYVSGTQWNEINTGDYSAAFGINTTASGIRSLSTGSNTQAIGDISTAMGVSSIASGNYSTAMGSSTEASGNYSTAMGGSTTASGLYSTATGNLTAATGQSSTASGGSTTASGHYSTAMGVNTTAQAYASVVTGRFNEIQGTTTTWIDTNPLFVIGNGTDDLNRSNALTVLKNGNVGIGSSAPAEKLSVDGIIESTTGGVKFPDGTVQTSSKIEQLIKDFVVASGESVTTGDVVSFVDGYVKKGVIQGDRPAFGSEFINETDGFISISATALSTTDFIIAYSGFIDIDNQYGAIIRGQISGSNISYISEYIFNPDQSGGVSVAALDSSTFLAAYSDGGNSSHGTAVICYLSGSSVNCGTEYVFNASPTDTISLGALSSGSFVIAYSDVGNSSYGTAVIGTRFSTTIAFGAEYVFNPSNTNRISSAGLSNSKFVLAYGTKAIIGDVSGHTITYGSSYEFNSTGVIDHVSVFGITTSKFGIAYEHDLNPTYLGKVIVGDVAGAVITFGSEYTFHAGEVSAISASALSQAKFIVAYTAGYGYALVGNVSGNVIEYGSEPVFYSRYGSPITAVSSSSEFIVVFTWSQGYGTILGDLTNNLVGIAKETKSAGQSVPVIIEGISDVHGGLTTGKRYFSDSSGNLTTSDTGWRIGTAISSTELMLNGNDNNEVDQYFGDMIFANNFRITEAGEYGGLIMKNQFNREVLTVNDSGDLNISGLMQLPKNTSAPAVCSQGNDGKVALTGNYQICVCNGAEWVSVSDGVTACTW